MLPTHNLHPKPQRVARLKLTPSFVVIYLTSLINIRANPIVNQDFHNESSTSSEGKPFSTLLGGCLADDCSTANQPAQYNLSNESQVSGYVLRTGVNHNHRNEIERPSMLQQAIDLGESSNYTMFGDEFLSNQQKYEENKKGTLDSQSSGSIYSSLLKILGHLRQQIEHDNLLTDRADLMKPVHGAFGPWKVKKFSKQAFNRDDEFKPMKGMLDSSIIKSSSSKDDQKDGAITTIEIAGEPLHKSHSYSAKLSSLAEFANNRPIALTTDPIQANSGTNFDDTTQTGLDLAPNEIGVSKPNIGGTNHDGTLVMSSADLANKSTSWITNQGWLAHDRPILYKGGTVKDIVDDRTLISLSSESTVSSDHEADSGAPHANSDYQPPLTSDQVKSEGTTRTDVDIRSRRRPNEVPVRPRQGQRAYSDESGPPRPLVTGPRTGARWRGPAQQHGVGGKRYIYSTTSDGRVPARGVSAYRQPPDLPQESIRDSQQPTHAKQQASAVDDEGDSEEIVRSSAPSAAAYESDSTRDDLNQRQTRLSHTDIQLRQIYPEQVQQASGSNQQNQLHQNLITSRPQQQQDYSHVLIQQSTSQDPQQQPRTIYSLATAPGGLKSFLSGQSIATQMGTVGGQQIGSSNSFDSILPLPSTGGTLTSSNNPMHIQVQSSKLRQQRDLLNQPQTLQITAVPSLGYNGAGALVRLGPGAVAPVNGLYGGNGLPWNNYQDPFGRQMMMVNADRRELDWNFWIWPLLALVTLPLILSALFVPVFLKTIVILIQVLQSLGLLLPITNALGNQMSGSLAGTTVASSTNQMEETTTQT